MLTNDSATLARTIEIRRALVYVQGEHAGKIELPILLRNRDYRNCDLADLYLIVEGEKNPLKPFRREIFDGQLRLMFCSPYVKQTGRLPAGIQLLWGDHSSSENGEFGMVLEFREASNC